MPDTFTWNAQCLLRNGRPWLPIMGEFHYSRCPKQEWRTELYKMKACGVNIVATYAFWLHHEERKNQFDFSDRRDLKTFLRICGECGLYVWLRIGPWCHGEARNGGFPDWLMNKGIPLRTNHKAYLSYVRRYWERLYEQSKDVLYANGGAVIGIQFENEYGHCGGEGDPSHMAKLIAMAEEIGFSAPYYSATGWGGACIGTALPVMSCYCDAPWSPLRKPLPPSPNYIFSHERNDADVGSDFKHGAHVSFDEDMYPYLLAEMGGGIGCTFHRRPVAAPVDTGAMSLVKLGSGANMLGYYMYHGGVNPGGGLNETRESGSYTETPVLSYMPHAPIGEYGQIGELAKELKRLALFTRSFGERLAPLPCTLPEEGAKQPTDAESPRYAWRIKEHSGFLFVSNHQRGATLPAREYEVPGYGHISLASGEYGIYPYNLPVGKATLYKANATPLCVLNGHTYVFWCDGEPNYQFDREPEDCRIVTLTGREAKDAWLVEWKGEERLYICEYPVVADASGVFVDARGSCLIRAVPEGMPQRLCADDTHPSVTYRRTSVNYQCFEYEITPHYEGAPENAFLRIDYEGSLAELYVDGERVADDMFDGGIWEVGLKRFGFPAKLTLRIYALFEGMPVWLQQPPEYIDGRALRLRGITMENSFCIRLDERVLTPS